MSALLQRFKAEVKKTFRRRKYGAFLALSVPHFNDVSLAKQATDFIFEYFEKKGITDVNDTLRVIAVDNKYIQAITFIPTDELAKEKLEEFWASDEQKNIFAYQVCSQQDAYYARKH